MSEPLSSGGIAAAESADPVKVTVALGGRPYDILVGQGLIDGLAEHLAPLLARPRVFLVTEERVAALHLDRAAAALERGGIQVEPIVLPAGESTKSFQHLEQLCREVISRQLERSDLLLALGGGVIGDLVGFAAAILLRGVGFVQLPTTLLAQVDSSVGGKTAIDIPEGKNLVGAFHQPQLVLADSDLLATLSTREMRAGYAEVLKYGLLGDLGFFEWLESHGSEVLAGDREALTHAVVTSCRAKAGVVARDELEAGERALLNLGHTFGHALEVAIGYGDQLLHGEAVSIGLGLAFRLSADLGLCTRQEAVRVERHLDQLGMPTKASFLETEGLSAKRLVALMGRDKKVEAGRITFILARAIGEAFIARDIDLAKVEVLLDAWLAA